MTLEQLMTICPQLDETRAREYLPLLAEAMDDAGISGAPLREAAFVATLAHESNGLTQLVEVSPQAQAYVSKALGNADLSDARRYIGRGPGQITGRRNYDTIGKMMGVDLIGHPYMLADPQYGFLAAAKYWELCGAAKWADHGNFRVVSSLWNNGQVTGSINGWDSRQIYYNRALKVLLGDQHGTASQR